MSGFLSAYADFSIKFVAVLLRSIGWMPFFLAALIALAAASAAIEANVISAATLLVFALLFAASGRWVLRRTPWLVGLYVREVEKRRARNQAIERRVIEFAKAAPAKTKDALDNWKADRQRHASLLHEVKARSSIETLKVYILGGSGWESLSKQELILSHNDENIYLTDEKTLVETTIPLRQLRKIDLGGPGKVTEGGGVSGGGFGMEGFLQGAALATVLNVLTTRTSTKTIINLSLHGSELIFLNSEIDPEAMRVRLSKLFVVINETQGSSRAMLDDTTSKLTVLADLHRKGDLSDQEFSAAKKRLLT